MLSLMWYLRDRLSCLRDQRGVVHMEYVLVGALAVAAAAAIFAVLSGALAGTMTTITDFINAEVTSSTT